MSQPTSAPPATAFRILCCLHAPDLGGVERVALRLCRNWAEAGADVRIALGRSDGRAIDAGAARVLAPPTPPFSPAPFETAWMIVWLAMCTWRVRPDVLFCPGNSYTVVAAAMRLLFGRGCPVIVAKLSNDLDRGTLPTPVRPLYNAWLWLQGRLIDRFVALSPAMRDASAALLGIARGRIGIVANPVLDDAALADLARAGDAARASRGPGRRFVCAGRLVPQKNHALLLEAFAHGAAPEDTLTIVGNGPLRARLARAIVRAGLADRVVLAGARRHPTEWLGACDVLLLSSDYEGLPAVVVEAVAAGVAVIATDCCASMRDLLGDGEGGTLVAPGDRAALAHAIARAQPKVHAEDRRRDAARFTIGASGPAFLAFLHRAAVRRSSPRRGVAIQERRT